MIMRGMKLLSQRIEQIPPMTLRVLPGPRHGTYLNPSSDHVAAGTLLVNWFFLTYYSESSALAGEILPLTFPAPALSLYLSLQRIHHGSLVSKANARLVLSLQASGRPNAE
ncbi:hypothetical protein ACMYSQ_005074 [Aspergillus niger]